MSNLHDYMKNPALAKECIVANKEKEYKKLRELRKEIHKKEP